MNKFIFAILLFIALGAVGYFAFVSDDASAGRLDSFAACLAEKGAVMYGAYWCPHCQNEKRAFGSSFRLVPYVECTEEPDRCVAAGIQGYPTWIFPAAPSGTPALSGSASGERRFEGEQGIEKLSEISGCALPAQ